MLQLKIEHPTPNQIVAPGQPFSVGGVATDKGMPDPALIDSVTVAVDNQPPIPATLKIIPHQTLTTVTFSATVQAPNVLGQHTIAVKATNNSGISATKSVTVLVADAATSPIVQTITVDFHTYDDDLNSDSLLHIFVKNRASDSSDSGGAGTFQANLQDYLDHDADWYGKNPFLGYAINASQAQTFGNNSTNRVNIQPRSKPIPFEELLLPEVIIHILPKSSDTWKFDYTLTITLDDGTVLPPFSSNINGLTGIILNEDNRNYSGICTELRPIPPRTKYPTDAFLLTGVTIEFHTHGDKKNSDTTLNVHIVNRLSATASTDISVATDIAKGQTFPDFGDTYKRIDLPLASQFIYLRDMVLPVVFINIGASNDRWMFDYRVTFFAEQAQPYSWTVSGVVLDQDHHKHMGVYNGRPFPTIYYPMAPISQTGRRVTKNISLAFLGQKLQELFNSRQVEGSQDPIIKLKLDSSKSFGDQIPPSFLDLQFIANDPPPPDGQPLRPDFHMGIKYGHGIRELGQFTTVFGLGVYLVDINSKSFTLTVNSGDNQTPLTLDLQFETDGPQEIQGSIGLDLVRAELKIRLTLRLHAATNAVDLFGWVDDINGITYTPQSSVGGLTSYKVSGIFLGQALDSVTPDPASFRTDLIRQVIDVVFNTSETTDPGGAIQKRLPEAVFNYLLEADSITKVTMRDSINATASSWLMGSVVASGNPELVPYPYPCRLFDLQVNNDVLFLDYATPAMAFQYHKAADWPLTMDPGALANIDHIIVLMQENRSFDHMLGYLSLPFEKGGMGRNDVDGLKGGEFNMFNGQKYSSFRLAAGDTIFSPGPPNDTERVAVQINSGKMDGFVQAQADECGPATAPRVMGYHAADNVPTYNSLARDFAVGHRWFASHPGPTFPNRFYELTGRPNVDPWGAWEYANSSPLIPMLNDTIFDWLKSESVSWINFEHFYCFLRFFERYTFDSENVVSFDDPVKGFKALAKSGNLPAVSFIEPHYVDYPPDSFCDEPPSDIRNSQKFIRDLVETVVASPNWDKTLMILTYDEHGGFYDHVPPPSAVPVVPGMLRTTGIRVPCFVISPWIKGGSVFGSDTLHFDHTSILKTIVRRFMSSNPPYMGARYAAAHDLSEILDTQIRPGPFRPFIPYTLVYVASNMCLGVQNASLSAGTPIVQLSPNPNDLAQDFRFEDAGNGFFYIRTLSNLYVTVPSGDLGGGGAATDAGAGSGSSNTANTPGSGVIQDVKYPPLQIESSVKPRPALQMWKLTSASLSPRDVDLYVISNQAYPTVVLQPANPSQSQSLIVLGPANGGGSGTHTQKSWKVTSPLFSDGITSA